jgi:hypothetical protein
MTAPMRSISSPRPLYGRFASQPPLAWPQRGGEQALRDVWPRRRPQVPPRSRDSMLARIMSGRASLWTRLLFGQSLGSNDVAIILSARFDEAGTDERSPYAVVAGAVSTVDHWDKLEVGWDGLMKRHGVPIYHHIDFAQRNDHFSGWSKFKRDHFVERQERIIRRNTLFEFAVAVERATHAQIKAKWRGVKGFKADSDCGLCFRIARFFVCDWVTGLIPGRDVKVQFLAESGPFTADMGVIYDQIYAARDGKYRPAKYAGMLGGFTHVPKGMLRSLEAADYVAGRSLDDIERGQLISAKREHFRVVQATPELLELWNEDMLKEKEHRKQHAIAKRRAKAAVS